MALKISLPEHAPTTAAGEEMIGILSEIWDYVLAKSESSTEVETTPRVFSQRTVTPDVPHAIEQNQFQN